jgi:hypothetical protein
MIEILFNEIKYFFSQETLAFYILKNIIKSEILLDNDIYMVMTLIFLSNHFFYSTE